MKYGLIHESTKLDDLHIEELKNFHINNSYYQTYLMEGNEDKVEKAADQQNEPKEPQRFDEHP